jgi:hypothetical protein
MSAAAMAVASPPQRMSATGRASCSMADATSYARSAGWFAKILLIPFKARL